MPEKMASAKNREGGYTKMPNSPSYFSLFFFRPLPLSTHATQAAAVTNSISTYSISGMRTRTTWDETKPLTTASFLISSIRSSEYFFWETFIHKLHRHTKYMSMCRSVTKYCKYNDDKRAFQWIEHTTLFYPDKLLHALIYVHWK